VVAEIPQRGGAQQSVGDSMQQHVRVRVAAQTPRARDLHAAQNEHAAGLEGVDVVTDADSHGRQSTRASVRLRVGRW